MESVVKLRVPLIADVAIGQSWGQAKKPDKPDLLEVSNETIDTETAQEATVS
jgi:hypothetical protein